MIILNTIILKYFYHSRGFVPDNYPVEQTLESAERRQDVSDLELENLLMKERQLQVMSRSQKYFTRRKIFWYWLEIIQFLPQELLARESELTTEQREELLRQLAAWPANTPTEVGSPISCLFVLVWGKGSFNLFPEKSPVSFLRVVKWTKKRPKRP